MLADIKAGRIKRVIVKDMSRFGRDYLQVGMYTDVVFPEFGVHFIAVNDGVDSTRGESEFTAIRNVFNEMYARDTSKKIRATWQSKGKSGEHLTTIPPYGYMKSPEDKKKWIVDEEAAAVVQKIFSLCASGKGPTQIAKWLKQQQILNPTAYCYAKGLPTSNKPTADPYKWTNETVSRILERVDYLGHTVNFKTTKMSHDYELEQSNLKSMAEVLRKDLKQQEQQKTNVRAFIAAVKKYTDLQELDAAVLRAFIDRIEVSHVDKKSRTREITIVYNFIGAFDFTRAIENARNTSKKEQRTA